MFDSLRETFFDNRIAPGVEVRFVPSKQLKVDKKNGSDAVWNPGTREIHIDEMYARSEPMTAILLIHEMAHAALEPTYVGQSSGEGAHGMIYQAELVRLFNAGAYDGLL
jgi:hypothetical protein